MPSVLSHCLPPWKSWLSLFQWSRKYTVFASQQTSQSWVSLHLILCLFSVTGFFPCWDSAYLLLTFFLHLLLVQKVKNCEILLYPKIKKSCPCFSFSFTVLCLTRNRSQNLKLAFLIQFLTLC